MLIMPSFKKSLIVEQFQGNYLKPRGFEQDIHSLLEMLSFVCYKPVTCIKYNPPDKKIWIFPQEISVNLSIKYIGMLSDISTDP